MPAILAQIVSSLYNVVDRIFIGHSEGGELALAGVGVCGSVLSVITAVNAFVGNGGAPIFSIALGRNDRNKAEKILGNSILLLLISSISLMVVYLIFGKSILLMFGASENTISYAYDYLRIYILGNVFCQLTYGLNPYISAQGFSGIAMGTTLLGAIINLILDPLLIYVFNMGVKGAALASVIGQFFSAIWVMFFLLKGKNVINIKLSNLRMEAKIIFSIAAMGLTPFVMHFTESVVSVTINSSLESWGSDLYVSTMAVVTATFQMFLMPVWGIMGGLQPILSYNYGAKNYDRVKKTFKIMLYLVLPLTVLVTLTAGLFPKMFIYMFSDSEELLHVAVSIFSIYFAGVWAFGIQTSCQSLLMSLGQAKISMFLALLRKIILLLPLVLFLPQFLGVQGIFVAQPIADIGAAVITSFLAIIVLRRKVA